MCIENDEPTKYLMTFQNILSKVPSWNSVIVQEEVDRIVAKSGCTYIGDLITCVHIIQLKVMTCVKVGSKQKKIDISIPKLDHFIHSVYIHIARKLYSNVYLFKKTDDQLQIQKNFHDVENIIRECILRTIRESIPTEHIVKAYLDENVEHEEEVYIEHIHEPAPAPPEVVVPAASATAAAPTPNLMSTVPTVSLNDNDFIMDEKKFEKEDIDTSAMSASFDDIDDDSEKIKIHSGDDINLDDLDIFVESLDAAATESKKEDDDLVLDIETLM